MLPSPSGFPSPTLAQRLEIAACRLAARGDVLVTRFVSASRQPPGALGKALPADLAALYAGVGAFHLRWRFTDEQRIRGSFCLRAPGGGGWIGAGPEALLQRAEAAPLAQLTGYPAFRTIGRDPLALAGAGGVPWPAGTRFAILEGVEEAALVLRVDPGGGASYAVYDSDGCARDLGDDLGAILDRAIAGGLTGYGDLRSAETARRLAEPAPPRPFARIEVLEAGEVPWGEARAIALAALSPSERAALGRSLGLGDLGRAPAAEAGRRIAAATADPRPLDPGVLGAFSGIKKTKAALADKLLCASAAPYAALRLRITAEPGPYPRPSYSALRYPPTASDGEFARKQAGLPSDLSALRLLPDVPGVDLAAVSDLDPDVLRFCARLPRAAVAWAHERLESQDGASVVTTLAVPASAARGVRAGQTAVSGARPLFGGPSFEAR